MNAKRVKAAKVATHSKRGRVTQSYKLYQLLAKKKAATSADLAKVIGRPTHQTAVYVAELTRVYGAKIVYDTQSRRYVLQNRVEVPPQGVAGLRWKSHQYKPVQHIAIGRRGRPAARASAQAAQ